MSSTRYRSACESRRMSCRRGYHLRTRWPELERQPMRSRFLAWVCLIAFNAHAADRPNILYILADDLGYGDVSCFNPNSKIKTPNIDRLASAGMRFTDAHSASAVCTPTRAGILT